MTARVICIQFIARSSLPWLSSASAQLIPCRGSLSKKLRASIDPACLAALHPLSNPNHDLHGESYILALNKYIEKIIPSLSNGKILIKGQTSSHPGQ